eukprot:g12214.t1
MDFDDDIQDDSHGNRLNEEYGKEYDAMEQKNKAKRKEQKLKHAYKADARIWNDETKNWVKKLDRNRGSTCTLTMLLTELNFVFGSEEGRKKLETERMAAKDIFDKNKQGNNKHKKKYPD